jgi:RimJ/RimL family protein N-acetyltransferase
VSGPWLPVGFAHPERVELPTAHHLRPIRESDVEIDYPAVMGSRDRLWTIFGPPWGWPPATMTFEQDRADLARHEREQRENLSFNYAVFDTAESALFGCIYIDPPERVGADADISWWVVDAAVGTPLEAELAEFVPRWLASAWPFTKPRFVGRDLTWAQWLTLAEIAPRDT